MVPAGCIRDGGWRTCDRGFRLRSHRVIVGACGRLSRTGVGHRSMRGGRGSSRLANGARARWRSCARPADQGDASNAGGSASCRKARPGSTGSCGSAVDRREVVGPSHRPHPVGPEEAQGVTLTMNASATAQHRLKTARRHSHRPVRYTSPPPCLDEFVFRFTTGTEIATLPSCPCSCRLCAPNLTPAAS